MKYQSEDFTSTQCGCREADCPHVSLMDRNEPAALNALVDAFSEAMKAKLKEKLKTGRGGWDDERWTPEMIMKALKEHVDKGDPVDIANFCAFLWNRH